MTQEEESLLIVLVNSNLTIFKLDMIRKKVAGT